MSLQPLIPMTAAHLSEDGQVPCAGLDEGRTKWAFNTEEDAVTAADIIARSEPDSPPLRPYQCTREDCRWAGRWHLTSEDPSTLHFPPRPRQADYERRRRRHRR